MISLLLLFYLVKLLLTKQSCTKKTEPEYHRDALADFHANDLPIVLWNHRSHDVQTMVLNKSRLWKCNMATAFFPAFWQTPSLLFVFLHSPRISQIINKHWWGDFYKIVKAANYCLFCQVHSFQEKKKTATTTLIPRELQPPSTKNLSTCIWI